MKLILTVGISASGKTTWVNNSRLYNTVNINRDDIRFNIVQPGSNWKTYKFNSGNESKVTQFELRLAESAVKTHENIIISNTNLNPKIRNFWKEYAKKNGYEFEIIEFPITLEEAIKRDRLRQNSVGEKVLYKQYQQWLEYIGRKTYIPNKDLPKCLIVDIDGTIAKMTNRGPFEWDKVSHDEPRKFVLDMIEGIVKENDCFVVYLSGRDSVCEPDTRKWIYDNTSDYVFSHNWQLYMRKENDTRKDCIVKEEIFWDKIASKYNVIGVFDDRPQVLQMWHELKLPNVICVGNPFEEF